MRSSAEQVYRKYGLRSWNQSRTQDIAKEPNRSEDDAKSRIAVKMMLKSHNNLKVQLRVELISDISKDPI